VAGAYSRAVTGLRLDHIVLGVQDLEVAARRMLDQFGLDSVVGGAHVGWGTANRIVPLGSTYVELLAVADVEQASRSFLGRHVLSAVREGDRLLGWCVSVDDVDQVATRLALEPSEGSRARPDGTILRWRGAGLEEAMGDPSRPFFISWLVPESLHPGRTRVRHRVAPGDLAWVEVAGDGEALRAWLGPQGRSLPVRVGAGPPGLVAVGIASASGELVLR